MILRDEPINTKRVPLKDLPPAIVFIALFGSRYMMIP